MATPGVTLVQPVVVPVVGSVNEVVPPVIKDVAPVIGETDGVGLTETTPAPDVAVLVVTVHVVVH